LLDVHDEAEFPPANESVPSQNQPFLGTPARAERSGPGLQEATLEFKVGGPELELAEAEAFALERSPGPNEVATELARAKLAVADLAGEVD